MSIASRRLNRFNRSSNPVFQEQVLRRVKGDDATGGASMTVDSAVNKSFLLFAILLFSSVLGWKMASPVVLWGGAIGGLVLVIFTVFKMKYAPITAPLYAALEGLFVGAVSAFYAQLMSGIIFKAVALTFAVLFVMLFIYKSGLIKVTDRFRRGVIIATGAVLLVYVLNLLLSLFGIQMPFLHEGGLLGIGLSLAIVAIASLNLLLDFDNFEKGAKQGAPKYFEWFCAMGLLVTLVWLYIEILRLLAILNSND